MKEKLMKHLVLYSFLLAELIGFTIVIIFIVYKDGNFKVTLEEVRFFLLSVFIFGTFIIYPMVLTLINFIFLFIKGRNPEVIRCGRIFEYITISLGIIFSLLAFGMSQIKFDSDWMVVLYKNEQHTPIFTQSYVTIIVIAIVAMTAYFVLSSISLEKMPPLVTVCCIAAMYIGIIECIVWIVQIMKWDIIDIMLCLFPLNGIIIAIKIIKNKVIQWRNMQHDEIKLYKYNFLNVLNKKLMNSATWPLMAFIIMWPLLGFLICILSLFGQRPDAAIRAWTETSDWRLSQRISPPSVYPDGHYLCTVAAGGHKAIVKPLRRGIRHGHEDIVVNRQLCVANAFEQILEEKTPRLHRIIRNFYDKYGFPLSKLIHSPYTADLIYMLMKPLEWIFLIVLYLCDVKPENRIAVQYIIKK
ncbi:hypothetical protein SAMN02745248_01285 [Hathewaya proteolytica DSM 3090]|uniref:Uncharacterized protein n=1 Tax=Hathewaya proteolytica DSM 3090 TaxID=1121331 RepID=A0A1M6N611_9CLOT|nr:DUF6688 family protein [Hathewaya proteolytica]SHJ91157.1 hypothetical protein SAMN02745248_01285 [Hathewaya proteolytica DSM 3090]